MWRFLRRSVLKNKNHLRQRSQEQFLSRRQKTANSVSAAKHQRFNSFNGGYAPGTSGVHSQHKDHLRMAATHWFWCFLVWFFSLEEQLENLFLSVLFFPDEKSIWFDAKHLAIWLLTNYKPFRLFYFVSRFLPKCFFSKIMFQCDFFISIF